jgi:hypothetical protein
LPRAAVPHIDRLRNLRLNPGPTIALFHLAEVYATGDRRVPSLRLPIEVPNPQTMAR